MPIEISESMLADLDELASGAGATRAGCARECMQLGLALLRPHRTCRPCPAFLAYSVPSSWRNNDGKLAGNCPRSIA